MPETVIVKADFRFKRALASTWTADNPTLGPGEPGLEKDTKRLKIGDGASPWNVLEYASVGVSALIESLLALEAVAGDVPYFDDADTFVTAPSQSFGRSVLDTANAGELRTLAELDAGISGVYAGVTGLTVENGLVTAITTA